MQRLARAVATAWACEAGNAFCRQDARTDFAAWLQDPASVGHDTLAATVCEGVRGAAASTVDAVVGKLLAEAADSSRAAIIQGLGCADRGIASASLLRLATEAASGLRRGEAALLYKAASRFGPSYVTNALSHYKANVQAVAQA